MTKPDWDYPWPPAYSNPFPRPGDLYRDTDHSRTVLKWLENSPALRGVPKKMKRDWAQCVFWFDHTASQLKHELDKAGWSKERVETTIIGKLTEEERNELAAHRARVMCIDACQRARQAIFGGDWLAAIHASYQAGMQSVGVEADIGRRQLYKRQRAQFSGPIALAKDQLKRKMLQEAKGRANKNSALSASDIAGILHKEHCKDKNCPSIRTIRAWLGPLKLGKRASPAK